MDAPNHGRKSQSVLTSIQDGSENSPATLETLEVFFQQYVETTPLGILVIDQAGSITFANNSAHRCFGYQPSELLGQSIETLVPDSLRSRHVKLREEYMDCPVQRFMAGRELFGRRKDGTQVSVAIGLNPLVIGNYRKVACSVMDLTEVKKAEQVLSRFFDLSLDLFCIANMNGYLVRVNPNFSRILGYPDQEFLTRPFLEFVHPDDHEPTRQAMANLARGQPVVQFCNRYRDSQGNYRWFEWNARAAPEDGNIFAVARDITERVQMEEELQARERRERAILDNTPAVVYVKSINGRYEFVNQRYADLLSVPRSEFIGKSDHEILSADNIALDLSKNDQRVFESGEKITIQETIPHDDGQHTYISEKFPLFDSQGKVTAVAGFSTDITDQLRIRETQQQLQLARAFQKKLYPVSAPVVEGLDAVGSAVPVSHVCGDYFDFMPNGPGRLLVSVGDVSGHGIGPALEMVAVRTMLRMLLRNFADLAHPVQDLNRLLCADLPESSFVSLFLAEIDAPRKRIRYIGAGHEALLFPAAGGYQRLKSTGILLGLDESATFEGETTIPIEEGDLFLLFTDGLTETTSKAGNPFGIARLIELVLKNREVCCEVLLQHLFVEIYEFASGRPILDDMTVIAVKLVGSK